MNTDTARQQMVEQQVRAWDVLDASVLETLSEVPRELFVPAEFQSMAFADVEIPIGNGQSMMTPTVEGRVLQSLALGKADDVLEIGTGSGFLAACMARLAHTVTSIDIDDDFLQRAAVNLKNAGVTNVDLMQMDATQQLPNGEFDAIVITGSIPAFDSRYVAALKPGGRVFVVTGDSPTMEAHLMRLDDAGNWSDTCLFETELLPLVNSDHRSGFSFDA